MKKRAKEQENRCYATAVTRFMRGTHVLVAFSPHTHLPNPFESQCQKLRGALKRRSASNREVPSATIRECAKEVPSEVIIFFLINYAIT